MAEPRHVEHVAVWLAEVFGGPPEFAERPRGLTDALLNGRLGLDGMQATSHRARWLGLMAGGGGGGAAGLSRSCTSRRSAIFAWREPAIAQEVSQDAPGTDLGEPGPTPRWGRDGLIG